MDLQSLQHEKLELILALVESLPAKDRFARLLARIKEILPCDAAALLSFRDHCFYPLATSGLRSEVMGLEFPLDRHPRLQQIAVHGAPLRFDADSPLPDPYDGWMMGTDPLPQVHDCLGIPLCQQGKLIGALTLDSIRPGCFSVLGDDALQAVSEVGAAALQLALQMSLLEERAACAADDLWQQVTKLPLRDATDAFQRRLIILALEESHGVWMMAAKRLGIDPGNLHRLAKRLGMKG